MTKTIVLSLLLAVLLSPKAAFAAENSQTPGEIFRVTPIILDARLIPGVRKTYEVTIQNLLKTSLGLHATIDHYTPDGEDDLITSKAKQDPILSWSTIASPDVIMAPQESKTITISITPPKSARNGNYYELIYLTPFFYQPVSTTHPLVLSRVGVLISGMIGEVDFTHLKSQSQILDMSLAKSGQQKLSALIHVQNNESYQFDAKPVITISSLFGNETTVRLQDKHVLPHTMRRFTQLLSFPTNQLVYHMHVVVSIGNGETIEKSRWFLLMPPEIVYIIVGGICLLFTTLLYLSRKRIVKAYRILIGRG